MYFLMLLPRITTSLPVFFPNSMKLFNLAIGEAKHDPIIALLSFSALNITSLSISLATISLGVFLAADEYNELGMTAKTFSFASFFSLFMSETAPTIGLSSNLKSLAYTITPFFVCRRTWVQ